MTYIHNLYDSNRYVRTFATKLGFTRPINVDILSSRIVEYPWTLNNLPLDNANRVLDVGSTGSQLPLMLAGLGLDVWTIDTRDYEYQEVTPNLKSVKGDIRKTDFSNEFFDIVTAISTIEHVGLGRYGDEKDSEGDTESIREVRRIMKPNATLLLTVPFGKKCITPAYRVYDRETIQTMLTGFNVIRIDFFTATPKIWIKTKESEVTNKDCSTKETATACIKAIKL